MEPSSKNVTKVTKYFREKNVAKRATIVPNRTKKFPKATENVRESKWLQIEWKIKKEIKSWR